jgi:hypothetical protein
MNENSMSRIICLSIWTVCQSSSEVIGLVAALLMPFFWPIAACLV